MYYYFYKCDNRVEARTVICLGVLTDGLAECSTVLLGLFLFGNGDCVVGVEFITFRLLFNLVLPYNGNIKN